MHVSVHLIEHLGQLGVGTSSTFQKAMNPKSDLAAWEISIKTHIFRPVTRDKCDFSRIFQHIANVCVYVYDKFKYLGRLTKVCEPCSQWQCVECPVKNGIWRLLSDPLGDIQAISIEILEHFHYKFCIWKHLFVTDVIYPRKLNYTSLSFDAIDYEKCNVR